MLFKSFQPAEELHPFIETYQVRHFILSPELQPAPKPYIARPEETMAFYIRGKESTYVINQQRKFVRPRAVLSGLWTGRIDRESVEKEFLMVQVIFRPGAVYKITGIPSSELVNNCIDLADIFPAATRILLSMLDYNPSYPALIGAIDKFLLQMLAKKQPQQLLFEKAFHLLRQNTNEQSIKLLAGDACMSLRQFERKAMDYIGVPTATYQRIARFAESFRIKTKNPRLTWLDVAIQTGYYDYQHLSRDYKAFAASTPNSIFAADQLALEKVLKLGDGY